MIGIHIAIPGLSSKTLVGIPLAALFINPIQQALTAQQLFGSLEYPPEMETSLKLVESLLRFPSGIEGRSKLEESIQQAKKMLEAQKQAPASDENIAAIKSLTDKISHAEALIAQEAERAAQLPAVSKALHVQIKQLREGVIVNALPLNGGLQFWIQVSDDAKALQIINGELERLGFLPFSEIAVQDQAGGDWHYFYPVGCTKDFKRHLPPSGDQKP